MDFLAQYYNNKIRILQEIQNFQTAEERKSLNPQLT